MNTKFTIDELAEWIETVKDAAEEDESFSIAWFKGTKKSPFAIIAGWIDGFSDEDDFSDMFCISASNPKYVMCIKIAVNDGPYAYTDYDLMNMPVDEDGEVDSTEIMLEWEDDSEDLAEFFMHEWERIMEEHGEDF